MDDGSSSLYVSQGPSLSTNTYYYNQVFNPPPTGIYLRINSPSLVGYTGGALVDVDHPDSLGGYSTRYIVHEPEQLLISGSLTPLSIPEPSSLVVLAVSAFSLAAGRGWVPAEGAQECGTTQQAIASKTGSSVRYDRSACRTRLELR